jgi:hypothetical protein
MYIFNLKVQGHFKQTLINDYLHTHTHTHKHLNIYECEICLYISFVSFVNLCDYSLFVNKLCYVKSLRKDFHIFAHRRVESTSLL